jgi:hypothetical protein
MKVRAKFYCANKAEAGHYNSPEKTHVLTLYPVTSGSTENEQFYKYTPTGELKLGTVVQSVGDQFEVGKTYYIDITPAD